jgi:hypothetical protein
MKIVVMKDRYLSDSRAENLSRDYKDLEVSVD